jgi:gamma-glutamyl hydrolase
MVYSAKSLRQDLIWLILSYYLLGVCHINCATLIDNNSQIKLTPANEYPVIGVLSQEISYSLEQKYPGEYKSYIAASYVKFVEGGGARVVPIW